MPEQNNPQDQNTEPGADEVRDDLESLPPARLAAMLREKRRAEQGVRERLREVETERDALSGRMTAWQSARLREYAKEAGVVPEAIEDAAGRLQLADLVGEDGTLDAAKTSAAFDGLKEKAGYLFTQPSHIARSSVEHRNPGGERQAGGAVTWGDVLS